MDQLKGLTIIFGLSALGQLLERLLPLPIPASIYGIGLLVALLSLGWVKEGTVGPVCDFLTGLLQLLFVPIIVGVALQWDLLKASGLALGAALLASTLVAMGCAGLGAQALIRRSREKEGKK